MVENKEFMSKALFSFSLELFGQDDSHRNIYFRSQHQKRPEFWLNLQAQNNIIMAKHQTQCQLNLLVNNVGNKAKFNTLLRQPLLNDLNYYE